MSLGTPGSDTQSVSSGNAIVKSILSTASGTLSGGGAAAQLFSSPEPRRNKVLISHSGGTGAMYVGFTSDVSSTKHFRKMVAGDAPLELDISPNVSVWVRPDGTGNNYTAHEAIAG